jgi:hypothetical protein
MVICTLSFDRVLKGPTPNVITISARHWIVNTSHMPDHKHTLYSKIHHVYFIRVIDLEAFVTLCHIFSIPLSGCWVRAMGEDIRKLV